MFFIAARHLPTLSFSQVQQWKLLTVAKISTEIFGQKFFQHQTHYLSGILPSRTHSQNNYSFCFQISAETLSLSQSSVKWHLSISWFCWSVQLLFVYAVWSFCFISSIIYTVMCFCMLLNTLFFKRISYVVVVVFVLFVLFWGDSVLYIVKRFEMSPGLGLDDDDHHHYHYYDYY